MSKFDELKKAAEKTQQAHHSQRAMIASVKEFEAMATPPMILELMAIQYQLIDALQGCIHLGMQPKKRNKISAALSAAGAQP